MKIYIKLSGEREITIEKEPSNGEWIGFVLALAGIIGVTVVLVTMFSNL